MEINLNKIIAIKCYSRVRNNWYADILEKGTYWWRFLGIIPIFKYTREENVYSLDGGWLTKEEIINSNEELWEKNYIDTDGFIYKKPLVAIWLVGDRNIGSYTWASKVKYFETVDAALDYKNNLIMDCQSKGIYFKEL